MQLPPGTIEVEKVVYETVTQDVPVYVIKEVEVVREIPIEARYFESVKEFENWVENNHGLITVGSTSFTSHDPLNDCEDQADRWQMRALDDGYLVSACPVKNGMVLDTNVGGIGYLVGLWTSIGNGFWYWEPVTGEITKLGVVRD